MLRESDYRRVLEAVRELNAPRSLAEFRVAAVNIAAELVGCQFAALNEVDLQTGKIEGFLNIVLAPNTKNRLAAALERNLHENPLVTHFKAQPDSAPVRMSNFLSRRALHGTNLYHEFFRHLETEEQLLVGVKLQRRAMIAFTFNRRRPTFSDRDCALLAALRPHLIQGYDNASRFSALQQDAALGRTFHENDTARVLVIAQNRIVFCSENARRILHFHFGEIGSRVPEKIADWLRGQNENPLEVAAPLHLRCLDSLVTVRKSGTCEDGVLLTLEEGAPTAPFRRSTDAPALETLISLGLTTRQSEVLLLLAHGQNNAQIAAQMHISAHTVRHHLEAIYEKLGVCNRNAAAQRALQTLHSPFVETT